MNISNVQMSIFYSNNSFDYNNKELVKLIDIFDGTEILPSFFVEINNKNKCNRPFIKNINNGSIIMFGSSRMDVKLDDMESNTNPIEYRDGFFTDFFQNNIPFLKKIKNTFDLNVNRLAVNIYLSSKNNEIVNILKKIDFYGDSNKYNVRMDKKHKFNKLNHDINVISNLVSAESSSMIFCTLDINTVINDTSKFNDEDIDIFFEEGFKLSNIIINELIVN